MLMLLFAATALAPVQAHDQSKSCPDKSSQIMSDKGSDLLLLQTKASRAQVHQKRATYKLHRDRQCDVHHLHVTPVLATKEEAEAHCDGDPQCSGLYDTGCDGLGFLVCTQDFTLIPALKKKKRKTSKSRFQGCVYTKPDWTPLTWMKNSTGCKCYFDESRMDCACCSPGGCQCSQSPDRCVPCDAMYKCVVKVDLNDFPDLVQKVSPALFAKLNEVLEANTYEGRQSGIRGFLQKAYELPTTAAKVQAVALLDAKLNAHRSSDMVFEFPDADEVEEWLASWFLEDEIWSHLTLSRRRRKKTKKSNSTKLSIMQEEELPVIKGLVSRSALMQTNLKKCNWKVALQSFYAAGGAYGNWCGKAPPGIGKGQMISYGACSGEKSKHGKFGLDVCKDSGFDEGCSRHDQGSYSENVFGLATKSLCKVDADFKATRVKLNLSSNFTDETSRLEKMALVGANCLFDMMPCLRYEKKVYWDWCAGWGGGYPCKKTKVGYITHWPMGDYSKFKDDACGPPGCYTEPKAGSTATFGATFGSSISDLRSESSEAYSADSLYDPSL